MEAVSRKADFPMDMQGQTVLNVYRSLDNENTRYAKEIVIVRHLMKDYSNMPAKELLETVFPEQEIET